MTQATALKKAQDLKAMLLSYGVPEVSIELHQGRPVTFQSDRWDSLSIVTEFSHHTVSSYRASNLTPVLALCKSGRSDVPGPLCNGYGGWDLTYRIITFGYANHPGAGGPIVVNNFRIPQDSARRYAWGTEWEGGITEADWDKVLTNPRNKKKMTMREFMGRANAAIQDYFNVPTDAHLEHSTWTTRKVDRLNYTRAEGIAEIKQYGKKIATPPLGQSSTIWYPPPGTWYTPRDTALRPVMSYGALIYCGKVRATSGWYSQYRHQAMLSLKALGIVPNDTPDTNFIEAWYEFEKRIGRDVPNSVPDQYSFEYFVDRCGYWPPDGWARCGMIKNDWPIEARDR